jgi:alcohol dehydrogenase (cytochrome c)
MRNRGQLFNLLPGVLLAISSAVSAFAVAEQANSKTTAVPGKILGASEYAENCAACHGADLNGGRFAPSLKGGAFRAKWTAASPSALRKFISGQMPPASPGGLSSATYDKIVKYILLANRLPVAARSASSLPPDLKTKEAAVSTRATSDNQDPIYRAEMARRSAVAHAVPTISDEMLRSPPAKDWLSARRTDDGQAFSPLTQIDRANVKSLIPSYALALPTGTNEITPLVADGVIYLDSSGIVLAVEAVSGRILWKFERPTSKTNPVAPPISQPRGMATLADSLFVPTSDGHVIALNIHTGEVLWDHSFEVHDQGFVASPLVVHGKVIIGIGGCWNVKANATCFMAALDAKTGAEAWRFNTIPRPDEPNGDSWNGAPFDQRVGGGIWAPATYDPGTNLIYFGTGQTYYLKPLMTGSPVPTDKSAALYTDSTVALNPDTGKLAWFYQHMARDVWDMDWSFERIIATIPVAEKPRTVILTVGKLGILDVLDATSGTYLFSVDLGVQNLVTKIDALTGFKTTNPALFPDPNDYKFICPLSVGARNWPATSYDPDRHLLFVPASDSCMEFGYSPDDAFQMKFAGRPRSNGDGNYGLLSAINVDTRKLQWTSRRRASVASSALSTRGGLVFAGSQDGIFRASDSDTGEELWKVQLDSQASSSPVTFEAKGIQYIAVTTGGGNPTDLARHFVTPELDQSSGRTTLWVFALAGSASHP